jgi:hypothetical protein
MAPPSMRTHKLQLILVTVLFTLIFRFSMLNIPIFLLSKIDILIFLLFSIGLLQRNRMICLLLLEELSQKGSCWPCSPFSQLA